MIVEAVREAGAEIEPEQRDAIEPVVENRREKRSVNICWLTAVSQ